MANNMSGYIDISILDLSITRCDGKLFKKRFLKCSKDSLKKETGAKKMALAFMYYKTIFIRFVFKLFTRLFAIKIRFNRHITRPHFCSFHTAIDMLCFCPKLIFENLVTYIFAQIFFRQNLTQQIGGSSNINFFELSHKLHNMYKIQC